MSKKSSFHGYDRRSLCARCKSLGMSVTRFACIAQRYESSIRPVKNASLAHCKAISASDVNLVTGEGEKAASTIFSLLPELRVVLEVVDLKGTILQNH